MSVSWEKIRSARKCYVCSQNVLLPMCAGPDPRKVARSVRFELTTPSSGGWCSDPLSYERAAHSAKNGAE